MPDLHERLAAAVNARLEVARAAAVGWDSAVRILLNHDLADTPLADAIVVYLDGNDPATVIRHCERDLKVLGRHAELPDSWGSCSYCLRDQMLTDWPCDEIRDLATAYGVEVTDA